MADSKTLIVSFWPEARSGKLEDDHFRLRTSVFRQKWILKKEFHS